MMKRRNPACSPSSGGNWEPSDADALVQPNEYEYECECDPSQFQSYSIFLSSVPFPKPKKIKSGIRSLTQGRSLLPNKQRGKCVCRAELSFSQDAPFAIAIGACMLNSLLFPYVKEEEEQEEDSAAIGPTDTRFAVMTIISFIPYFNWLSWIFAWMDAEKPRYAVYAAVYLAPYLRTNLSLSPEESWLPIASVVLCIIHIQLEASIRNGDIGGITFFNEVAKRFGMISGSKDGQYRRQRMHEGRRSTDVNIPSGKAWLRDEIRKWRIPRKPSHDVEHDDVDDKMKH